MSFKRQEKKLLKNVENKNLIRLVRHFRIKETFGNSTDVELEGKEYSDTRAITLVLLLKEDNEEIKESFYDLNDDNDINGFLNDYRYDSNVEGIGYSICSADDNFNKTRGRLIATGRALKGQKKL